MTIHFIQDELFKRRHGRSDLAATARRRASGCCHSGVQQCRKLQRGRAPLSALGSGF